MPKKTGTGSKWKLKCHKEKTGLFGSGKIVYAESKKIKALYRAKNINGLSGIKFAVAISKKAGKAVWRNRIKRLIKEAHRLSAGDLINFCFEKNMLLEIIFITGTLNENRFRKVRLSNIISDITELHSVIKLNLSARTQ